MLPCRLPAIPLPLIPELRRLLGGIGRASTFAMTFISDLNSLRNRTLAALDRLVVVVAVALASAPPATADTISGTASVIDGDTIEIHGVRIRFHAIDAIEGRQRCRLPDGHEWRCGRDAALALAGRISRSPVSCNIRDTDRYGRLVGVCFSDGVDLNAWMVKNGWAVAYRRYGLDYADEEDAARSAEIGIWMSDFLMPWDWRRK